MPPPITRAQVVEALKPMNVTPDNILELDDGTVVFRLRNTSNFEIDAARRALTRSQLLNSDSLGRERRSVMFTVSGYSPQGLQQRVTSMMREARQFAKDRDRQIRRGVGEAAMSPYRGSTRSEFVDLSEARVRQFQQPLSETVVPGQLIDPSLPDDIDDLLTLVDELNADHQRNAHRAALTGRRLASAVWDRSKSEHMNLARALETMPMHSYAFDARGEATRAMRQSSTTVRQRVDVGPQL